MMSSVCRRATRSRCSTVTVRGRAGSWYDGATFALETGTPALMYGPRSIDYAHTVGEYVPIDDLVHVAQGIAVAGLATVSLSDEAGEEHSCPTVTFVVQ